MSLLMRRSGNRLRLGVGLSMILSATTALALGATTAGAELRLAANRMSTPAAPTVTKLAPASGIALGGTAVVISGTNFTGVTEVDFGGTPATSFTVKNSKKLTAISPAGSGVEPVSVTTSAGTSVAGATSQYEYTSSTPIVSSLSPAEAHVAGNKKIKVKGENLGGATEVDFGETPGTKLRVVSATELQIVVPEGTGIVDVRVKTPGGISPISMGDRFKYSGEPPEVTGLFAATGPAAGGNHVLIAGKNLFGATSVMFGSTPATSFIVEDSEDIVAVAPPGTSGSGTRVHVTTYYGTSLDTACVKHRECSGEYDHYKYEAPTITSLSPANGPSAGGTAVTLTGSGFAPGDEGTEVVFGGNEATAVECSSTQHCTLLTPAHAVGSASVIVRVHENNSGAAATFLYE
jgi:large repetitive protein